MKIAHISDLHMDKAYKKGNVKKTIHLFEYIIDNKFDHVIISGDITENADISSFELAKDLFKKFGLLSSKNLQWLATMIMRRVHLAEDVKFPAKCKTTDYKKSVFSKYFHDFSKTIQSLKTISSHSSRNLMTFSLIGLNFMRNIPYKKSICFKR
jgi:3',5'-cyclic AMP phosphodiesterase CpdA